MNVTVIVDLQLCFDSARYGYVNVACRRLANKAIYNDELLVVLEYKGCGPSQPWLENLCNSNKNVIKVSKSDMGGGAEIISALEEKQIMPKKFIFGGIQTNYCVRETIEQIYAARPDIELELVRSATADHKSNKFKAIQRLKENIPSLIIS